jgi:hypothetical protein
LILPGLATNPPLIVGDTSSLTQLVIAEDATVLRALKQSYGIQMAITEAVEAELRRVIRYKFPTKESFLKKALSSKLFSVIDKTLLISLGYKAVPALLEQMDQLGEKFHRRVDRGEAYTHAASNVLGVPTLSQDIVALWQLVNDGIDVQRPVLRAFDILIFGAHVGVCDLESCARARKQLLRAKETILACFDNCSVADGLPNFYLRICDADLDILGAQQPISPFDERIFVRKTSPLPPSE